MDGTLVNMQWGHWRLIHVRQKWQPEDDPVSHYFSGLGVISHIYLKNENKNLKICYTQVFYQAKNQTSGFYSWCLGCNLNGKSLGVIIFILVCCWWKPLSDTWVSWISTALKSKRRWVFQINEAGNGCWCCFVLYRWASIPRSSS